MVGVCPGSFPFAWLGLSSHALDAFTAFTGMTRCTVSWRVIGSCPVCLSPVAFARRPSVPRPTRDESKAEAGEGAAAAAICAPQAEQGDNGR